MPLAVVLDDFLLKGGTCPDIQRHPHQIRIHSEIIMDIVGGVAAQRDTGAFGKKAKALGNIFWKALN
ncbi:MAG TPA: hypothetical protein G4O03_05310 [Dehalococcoidia bacterium]|jgi:hypothetical protein|nr:hypothetical protein [Dehalococcoidia bacterium]